MSEILLYLTALYAGMLLFAWLTRRLWRIRRLGHRLPLTLVTALLSLSLAAVAGVGTVGLMRLYEPYKVEIPKVERLTGLDAVARGRHIAETACTGCHSRNGELPLTGGINLSDAAGLPLGRIFPPNLTIRGAWSDATDGALFRAIRTGVTMGDRASAMALFGGRHLSDKDTLSLIAYMRQTEAAGEVAPRYEPSLLLALLVGLGEFDISPAPMDLGRSAPKRAASAEYGRYIIDYIGCADCHGIAFDGVLTTPLPAGPGLRQTGRRWTEEAFIENVRARAAMLSGTLMPWREMARLEDDELAAVYRYLASLAASPVPGL